MSTRTVRVRYSEVYRRERREWIWVITGGIAPPRQKISLLSGEYFFACGKSVVVDIFDILTFCHHGVDDR